MAEYEKDREFSLGWVLGGIALMFVVNWFAAFVAIGAGVTSIFVLAGISLASYAVVGFVIGWQSEGSTIIEAGIAAAAAIGIAIGLQRGIALEPAALVLGLAIPFGAAIFGAWIGEMVQGKVIVRDDD